ncbi:hypothetical protein [Nocardia sp. NBC_01009]|uniref:tetratricopeptide repeat protein n=1 Tax=Nocardia sp. NBC_01009 TaxID=2975996 RepID=UPI003870BFFF|nr:hypothetical protein OHA42_17115 [Nocardia sp. NBC_01009]
MNRRDDSGPRGGSGERGGFNRGGDSGQPGGSNRGGESGGRGGFNRGGDSGQRGGFNRGGDSGERGGFNRGGDSGQRGGFNRGSGDSGEHGGSGDRGGFNRGGDSGQRGGFNRGGDSRGGSADRGANRPDSGQRGGFKRRDSGERAGFGRSGERGGSDRGSFQRGDGPSEDRRRGGEGARAGGGGQSADRRPPRPEEPDLPDDIQASDLEPAVRRDLLSLDKTNAEAVARHLVMAARLIDDDPGLALAHARAARQRAGRIAVVRETAGVTAYHAGEWAEALSELRTARRMSGGSGLLAVMADCERGLGRPERAIELGRSDEARALSGDEASELRIVVAGARMDLGQYDQAVVTLQTSDLDPSRTGSAAARLFYAYADALVAAGRTDDGLTWFLNAASADLDGETDAEDRAAELTGETDL